MDEFLTAHLKGVSRTYAIVIPMLPRGLDEAVGLAYLLMRIVDTLEDAGQLDDPARRSALLGFDATLARGADLPVGVRQAPGDLAAERALMADASEVLRRIAGLPDAHRESIDECARKMIHGLVAMLDRSAARGVPYPGVRDFGELRTYCACVAGFVGEMLCSMMAHHLKAPGLRRLGPLALDLGTGLQLVNILKDSTSDARRGRRYLPAGPGAGAPTADLAADVLREARASLARGVDFVLALPAGAGRLRAFSGLPIAWGALTLARRERDPGTAKLDRSTIRETIAVFARLAGDDAALRGWLLGLLRPPRLDAVG